MARPSVNANQFAKSHAIGDLDLQSNPNPNILTLRVNLATSYTGGIEGGQVMKLVDLGGSDVAGGGLPNCDSIAALTDNPIGVVVQATKQGLVPPGKPIQVAGKGSVIWMAATAAIARGVPVLANVADAAHIGYVQATTGKTGKVLGITMDKATAADQLIRIQIIADGTQFSGSVSS